MCIVAAHVSTYKAVRILRVRLYYESSPTRTCRVVMLACLCAVPGSRPVGSTRHKVTPCPPALVRLQQHVQEDNPAQHVRRAFSWASLELSIFYQRYGPVGHTREDPLRSGDAMVCDRIGGVCFSGTQTQIPGMNNGTVCNHVENYVL